MLPKHHFRLHPVLAQQPSVAPQGWWESVQPPGRPSVDREEASLCPLPITAPWKPRVPRVNKWTSPNVHRQHNRQINDRQHVPTVGNYTLGVNDLGY